MEVAASGYLVVGMFGLILGLASRVRYAAVRGVFQEAAKDGIDSGHSHGTHCIAQYFAWADVASSLAVPHGIGLKTHLPRHKQGY
ncbi:hypothetical protein NM688_g5854 [Phlebia brevispora]|uniref:Uncharacterized protein n=1 Tax=Phlebia brevispora TaxID=194682 RepID=A0ACC1SP12_9APHY|nr:hypothetical protein NM688_g5854 [Phlebia brevispora]